MKDKNIGRYTVPSDEDYEPGSNDLVLKNYLEIKSKSLIEEIEAQELKRTELEVIKIFGKDHIFTAADICNIHELWLGDIYPFAGKYRTVNMQKDGFLFAPANRISDLMHKFERDYLFKSTPCQILDDDELTYILAVIHVELILIHPFREGNGRIARLLADLMVWQARERLLDFQSIDQTVHRDGFKSYIAAIHEGLSENYIPMQRVFQRILEDSI